MNGRPKNYSAMCKAVTACKHPEIDGTDKSILAKLAQAVANYVDGSGSRPGNVNLMDAACLKSSALHVRLGRLQAFGLITMTERGDGRGRASVFRICLEDSAYPDCAANGKEIFVEKPSVKPSGAQPEIRLNPPVLPLNPPVKRDEIPETLRPRPEHNNLFQQQPNHSSNQKDFSVKEKAGEAVGNLIYKHFELLSVPSKAGRIQLETLAGEYGAATLGYAMNFFVNRTAGFDGLKDIYGTFLRESESWILVAQKYIEDQARRARNQDATVQALVERVNAEDEAEKAAKEEAVGGCSMDFFMKEGGFSETEIEAIKKESSTMIRNSGRK